MNITGTIHQIDETKQVTATFAKREIVLEYAENPEYPQFLLFQLVQDRCGLVDGYKVGQEVAVEFNLRGRQWTSPSNEVKTFNTLEIWKITPVGNAPATAQPVAQAAKPPVAPAPVDDLPF